MEYNRFKIDDTLVDTLDYVIEHKTEELIEEFRNIGSIIEEKITPSVTFHIARANSSRNRYKDMLPYDHNIVHLKTSKGNKYALIVPITL